MGTNVLKTSAKLKSLNADFSMYKNQYQAGDII